MKDEIMLLADKMRQASVTNFHASDEWRDVLEAAVEKLVTENTELKDHLSTIRNQGAELEAAKADAQRYLEKLIECRSSVKIAANEFDRFMLRKQPHANQCDIDEQKRLHYLLDWIDAAMETTK